MIVFSLIFFSVLVSPFALLYALTVREARNPVSIFLFFLGTGLWLFPVGAIFEVSEVLGVNIPSQLGWILIAAPLSGVVLSWLKGDGSSTRFRWGALQAGVLLGGLFCHLIYLSSFDHNLTVSNAELVGDWRGRSGLLTLPLSDIQRDDFDRVILNGVHLTVSRSFGQLCLVEREDPDSTTVMYRKL